jgi:hypothetical protein
MDSIMKGELPAGALLGEYARRGAFTDCYSTVVPGAVPLPRYVVAFYTTALFRLERWILALALSRPSSDADIEALAAGRADGFSAWIVEARTDEQILLADVKGRTRSWLMVSPASAGSGAATRLYFGSGILQRTAGFRALSGVHRVYSRALLHAARARLPRVH